MLEVVLLGEFEMRSDGSLMDSRLRSPRTQALVGYLALHQGAPQLRQRLANLFWPDSTEAQARTNLRRELHTLRACLPDPDAVLVADQTSLWWRRDAPCRIDVAAFETAADEAEVALTSSADAAAFVAPARIAVDAYRGDLLPALYDDWVLAQRERLCRRCVSLLDGLIEAIDDDIAAAVTYARRRVELQPLEEVGHRMLIERLARAGDRAAALQAYHRCTSMLERELAGPSWLSREDGLLSQVSVGKRATPAYYPTQRLGA